MGMLDFSFPTIIFDQTAQPEIIAGRIWLDDNGDLFYCDGATYKQLNVSIGSIQEPIIENTLSILEVFAADTLTAVTSATMVRDVFFDATGYVNTIDTGNTTALFNTDKYENIDENAHGETMVSTASVTAKTGLKITANAVCKIRTITKNSNVNATKCYLTDDALNVLKTTDFAGDITDLDYGLASGITYYVLVDAAGGNYNRYKLAIGASYPYAGTALNLIAGWNGGGDDAGGVWCIEKIAANISLIVQTNDQTLTSTPTNFQVYGYKKTTAGTGAITADISFDSGANYQTAVALDTATTITNTGTGMILKLNLNAGASVGSAECKGVGVLYW